MKAKITRKTPIEVTPSQQIHVATDPGALLGSLRQLGSGRIICHCGALSLAIAADFRSMNSNGHDFTFSGGVLELALRDLQILVSTASCGLGLGVSLFDQRKNLQMVFHFCHGSPWGKWLESHIARGLLQAHSDPDLAPVNLCWCELWPQHAAASISMPGSLLEKRFATLTNSRTIETTLHSPQYELSAVVHPASFDILSSSVRFWDRPRTRVCYADLSSLSPKQHDTYVSLRC